MRAILAATLLLVAACDRTSTETGQDPSAGEGEATRPAAQQAQPDELMDDPRNEAVPLESPRAGTPARRGG